MQISFRDLVTTPPGNGDGAPTALHRPPRVLIVDDHPDGAAALGQVLELHGCEVRTAFDGSSALAALDGGFRPDHAVLDLKLPDMVGTELASLLRARLGRGARLVALTGHNGWREEARDNGSEFDEHLLKPVDLPALLAALHL